MGKNFFIVLILPVLMLAPLTAGAGVYVIPAEADTYLKQTAPSEVHGADPVLFVKSKSGDNFRSVFRFDLSTIPAGEVVVNAVAILHVVGSDGEPVEVFRVTGDWTEAGANWVNLGSRFDPNTVHAAFVPAVTGPVAVDISKLVRGWAEADFPNHGMVLIPQANDRTTSYASRETPIPSQAPLLQVITTSNPFMRVATGSYTGDGSVLQNVTGLGFRPDAVIIKGANTSPAVVRSITMFGDAAKELGTNSALITNAILSLDGDGFTVGSGVQSNETGVVYYWTAFRAAPGQMIAGSYLGDGVDNRNITGLGFQPHYVVVWAESGEHAMQRFFPQVGDASNQFDKSDPKTDRIQALLLDGFQVGTHNTVNNDKTTYHYIAWNSVADYIAVDAYNGNGNDDRDVVLPGFQPDAVLITPDENIYEPVLRPASLGGDATFRFKDGTPDTNLVQTFLPGGFQVGNHPGVNNNSVQYYFAAFRDNRTADLAVSLLVDDTVPNAGDTVNVYVTLSNNGPDDETGAEVTCPLPAGLTIISAEPSHGTYDDVSGVWDVGTLPAGSSAGMRIRASVDNGTAGTTLTVNAGITTSGLTDPVPENNTDSVDINVQGIDIAVQKSVDNASPNENEFISYFVTVTNNGPDDATGLAVTDTLPPGVSYNGNSPTHGSYAPGSGVWDIPALAVGDTAALEIDAVVDPGTAGSVVTNTARLYLVDQTDMDATNDTAVVDIVISSSDVAVSKQVDISDPDEGVTVTFTVIASNAGPDTATAVTVVDSLPDGLIYDTDSPDRGVYNPFTGEWEIGTLAPADSAVLFLSAVVAGGTAGETIVNTASVFNPDQTDPVVADNSASDSVTVRAADLVVFKTVDRNFANVGENVLYSIRVTNNGPNDATGVQVSDSLPDGVTYVSDVPSQGSYNLSAGKWSVGTVVPGDTATIDIAVVVDPGRGGQTVTNVATVLNVGTSDNVAANDTASAEFTVRLADLAVVKSVDIPTPAEADLVTYTVVVTNAGPDDATGVELTDQLPPGVTYAGDIPTRGTYNNATGIWDVGSLAAGENATLTLSATVDIGSRGFTINNAAAVTASDQADNTQGDNTDFAKITVQASGYRVATGYYEGTGSGLRPITGVGFQPDVVIVEGNDGYPAVVKTSSMIGDSCKALGGPSPAYDNFIASLDPDGFTIGPDGYENFVSNRYYWTAFKSSPGDMVVGSYVGDGLDDVDITGLGMTPAYVIVMPESAEKPVQRFPAQTGDASVTFDPEDETPDRIQAFLADGFQVGSDAAVNSAGVTYHFIAWAETPLITGGNMYTGDGTDDRSVADPGFQPDHLIVKRAWNGGAAAQRPASMTGDRTLLVSSGVQIVDGIQTFLPDGFQVGSSAIVNEDTEPYYWMAFRDPLGKADLDLAMTASDTLALENDTLSLLVLLGNNGPDPSDGVKATLSIPNGLTLISAAPNTGSYSSTFGVWDVGTIGAGGQDSLLLVVSVDPGTAYSTVEMIAEITDKQQVDPVLTNNLVKTRIHIRPVVMVDDTPGTLFPARVFTDDSDLALHIGLDNPVDVGVTLDTTTTISFSDGTTAYAARLINTTYVGPYAGEFTLSFRPRPVPAAITPDSSYALELKLNGVRDDMMPFTQSLQTGGTNELFVGLPVVVATGLPTGHPPARPGDRGIELLVVEVDNNYSTPRTLDSLYVTNRSSGPGDQAALDSTIETVFLYEDSDDNASFSPPDALLSVAAFSAGRAGLAAGGLSLPPLGRRTLIVVADVDSLLARDGDRLDATIDNPADFVFAQPTTTDPSISPLTPVDSYGYATIDGMVAFQVRMEATAVDTLVSGALDQHVATIVLPANGYEADSLTSLALKDFSGDFSPSDLSAVRLYRDNGDGVFVAGEETLLGPMVYSGDRYDITGLSSPADGQTKLFVAADVAPDPTDGHRILAGIPVDGATMWSGNDGPIDTTVAAPSSQYIRRIERVVLTALPLSDAFPTPGQRDAPLLRLRVFNNTTQTVSLDSLRLKNETAGPGTQSQLDGELAGLSVYTDDGNGEVDDWDTRLGGEFLFSNGAAVAITPGLTIGPSLSADILVTCDVAASCARDGDSLRVLVENATAVHITPARQIDSEFPLVTGNAVVINGMMSFQLSVYPSADSLVLAETTDILVLDVEIPANGYATDVLQALEIHNQGTASDEHIQTLSLWADGGNGNYDSGAGDDALLGTLVSLGAAQYRRSGLNFPLTRTCSGGNRFFVSCDLKPDFSTSGTLQFMIPVLGIEVGSQNDGPVDQNVVDPSTQFIPTPDKLSVFPYSVGDKRVYPGSENVLNFGIGLYNGFRSAIKLETLRLFFDDTSSKTEIEKLTAFADTDSNGLFDPLTDTPIATITPSVGVFDTLTALSVELVPRRITYLFVAYDLDLTTRDSVTINMQLNAAGDMTLSPPLPLDNIVGEFAINSPGVDLTDGMIARQLSVAPAPAYRAAPGESGVLALGLRIPPNGIMSDHLNYLTIVNGGSALPVEDIAELNLWVEDGGDPASFDPAEDRLVTVMEQSGNGAWMNPGGISETIPVLPESGLKCYVTFTVAPTATDGRTFQAVVPRGGIQVDSGNDGPLDETVDNPEHQTISTDPLITTLWTDRQNYSIGQELVLRMRARNEGVDTLLSVTPDPPVQTGPGVATPVSGPLPASLDLAPGAESTFEWRYAASGAGDLTFCAFARNADSSTVSLETCASGVTIQRKPVEVDVVLDDYTPAAANRGQKNVETIQLSMFYINADSLSAPVLFNGIDVTVEDAAGAVPPASVFDEVTLVGSGGQYQPFATTDSLSTPLHLRFDEPVVIGLGDSVVIDVNADIASGADGSPFRLAIQSSGAVVVADANDGGPVAVAGAAPFPWTTRLVNVSMPAESLVACAPAAGRHLVNKGQDDVALFEWSLLNNGSVQTADEILTGVTLGIFDGTGAPVAPDGVLKNITLTADGVNLYSNSDLPQSENRVVCNLATGLLLPPQTPRQITVQADLRSFPSTDSFYVAIEGAWAVSARDNNSGLPVAVSCSCGNFPLNSSVFVYQSPASGISAMLTSRVPPDVLPSSSGVPLFDVGFSHVDTLASSIVVDSLAMAFLDKSGNPIYPGDYFSQLCVIHAGDTLATLVTLSSMTHLAETKLSPPVTIPPSGADSIAVFFTSKSVYPPAEFRVRIDREYVVARDANTGVRIPSVAGSFPFYSDPARLQLTGENVSVGVISQLPPNVAGNESDLGVFDFVIRNTSPPGYTSTTLKELKVRLRDWRGTALDATRYVSAAVLSGPAGQLAGGSIDAAGIRFVLPSGAVVTDAGDSDTVSVSVDLKTSGESTFRFVVADTADVHTFDATTGLPVSAATIDDQGYPLSSSFTHVLGSGGEQAFTNYPNPFPAGRGATRVTFYLESPSRISLKLYTLWGAPVKTLVDGEYRGAGLHQDVTWSGRNGDGDVVNNGVYYLVLEVQPSAGGPVTDYKRKVGVVR